MSGIYSVPRVVSYIAFVLKLEANVPFLLLAAVLDGPSGNSTSSGYAELTIYRVAESVETGDY